MSSTAGGNVLRGAYDLVGATVDSVFAIPPAVAPVIDQLQGMNLSLELLVAQNHDAIGKLQGLLDQSATPLAVIRDPHQSPTLLSPLDVLGVGNVKASALPRPEPQGQGLKGG